jgi:hypothetical protein
MMIFALADDILYSSMQPLMLQRIAQREAHVMIQVRGTYACTGLFNVDHIAQVFGFCFCFGGLK